jgi:hypothetical protein
MRYYVPTITATTTTTVSMTMTHVSLSNLPPVIISTSSSKLSLCRLRTATVQPVATRRRLCLSGVRYAFRSRARLNGEPSGREGHHRITSQLGRLVVTVCMDELLYNTILCTYLKNKSGSNLFRTKENDNVSLFTNSFLFRHY